MRYPVPIALAVLLALSLPVSAVGTAGSVGSAGSAAVADDGESTFQFQRSTTYVSGDHTQLDGTPNRLVLEGDRRTAYDSPTFDFGLAVASQDDSIRTDYRTYTFETSFSDIENESNRTDAVVAELDRIEGRIENLQEREQAIVAAHAAGEASEEEVLRTLARNYYEARELEKRLEHLSEHAGDVVVDKQIESNITVSDSVRGFRGELKVYTGPIREKIDVALRGVSSEEVNSTLSISIESSRDGLVLSTITNSEYIREVIRYDNRDRTIDDLPVDLGNIYNTGQEMYPWAYDNGRSGSVTPYHTANLYAITIEHEQGELTIFRDSGTDRVYSERQRLEFNRLPTDTEKQLIGENITAVLKSAPGNGPMKVSVVRANSTEPINASILVDNQQIGRTGADGEHWYVSPTDRFNLTIKTESESLNTTVTASY